MRKFSSLVIQFTSINFLCCTFLYTFIQSTFQIIPDYQIPFDVDSKFPVSQKLQMNFNSIFFLFSLEQRRRGRLFSHIFCVIFNLMRFELIIKHRDNNHARELNYSITPRIEISWAKLFSNANLKFFSAAFERVTDLRWVNFFPLNFREMNI